MIFSESESLQIAALKTAADKLRAKLAEVAAGVAGLAELNARKTFLEEQIKRSSIPALLEFGDELSLVQDECLRLGFQLPPLRDAVTAAERGLIPARADLWTDTQITANMLLEKSKASFIGADLAHYRGQLSKHSILGANPEEKADRVFGIACELGFKFGGGS